MTVGRRAESPALRSRKIVKFVRVRSGRCCGSHAVLALQSIMAGLAPPAPPPALTRDQTLAALREVSVLVSNPAVAAQLDAVKAAAGADAMMALMMVRLGRNERAANAAHALPEAGVCCSPAATPHAFLSPQVMPLAVQLLSPILSTYGYAPDQGGLVRHAFCCCAALPFRCAAVKP